MVWSARLSCADGASRVIRRSLDLSTGSRCRSSLVRFRSIDRVLEDPFDLPPVILCYKLDGEWFDSQRGGPVRVVVPEAYGFKSIKWLTHIVLSNLFHANDTYAEGNNDVDSWLKTFAATLSFPRQIKPGEPIPVIGYDLALTEISHAPDTLGFDASTGQPRSWPMRLAKIHWAILLPGVSAGEYTFRCRTIDEKGIAQPMPRPFRKSGHSAIESVDFSVMS